MSEDEGSAGEHGGREVSMLTRRGTGLGVGMGFHLQMGLWRMLRPWNGSEEWAGVPRKRHPPAACLFVATGVDVSVRKRMRQTPMMIELQGQQRRQPKVERRGVQDSYYQGFIFE